MERFVFQKTDKGFCVTDNDSGIVADVTGRNGQYLTQYKLKQEVSSVNAFNLPVVSAEMNRWLYENGLKKKVMNARTGVLLRMPMQRLIFRGEKDARRYIEEYPQETQDCTIFKSPTACCYDSGVTFSYDVKLNGDTIFNSEGFIKVSHAKTAARLSLQGINREGIVIEIREVNARINRVTLIEKAEMIEDGHILYETICRHYRGICL